MKYLSYIIMFFLCCPSAMALSWSEALDILEKQNPEILVGDIDAQISHLSLRDAKSQHWPTVDLRAGSRRFLQEDATLGFTSYVGFRIQWNLYQGGRVRLLKKKSNLQLTISELQSQKNRIIQTSLLKQAYARALYAKKNEEVNKAILERSKQNFRLVDLKYQSGSEYRWVWLVSKKNLAQDQLDLRMAQNEQVTALIELQELLQISSPPHLDQIEDVSLGLTTVEDQLRSLNRWTSKEHPDLVLAMHSLGLADYDRQLQQAARRPSVGLITDLSIVDTDDEPLFPLFAASVAMTMPVWEGGRRKRAVRIQEKRMQTKVIDFEKQRLKIEQDVEVARNQLEVQKMRVDIAKLEYEASKDRSIVVTQEYSSGFSTFDFWNRTQNQLNQAHRKLIAEQRDLQIQLAKFIQIKGEMNQ